MFAVGEQWSWSRLGRVLFREEAGPREIVEVALARDETWSARVFGSGVEVQCLSGTVWLTREGDPYDHVLSSGETFVSERSGRLALMALEPARVRVGRRRA
jgi:hypothetical protein